MKKVEIFTDGACSGNPGPGGWGAILRYGTREKEISGSEENQAEQFTAAYGIAEKLEKFTNGGGVVLMNGATGCFDGNGNNLAVPGPEMVSKLFGITIGENKTMSLTTPLVYVDSVDFAASHVVVRGELDNVHADGTIGSWTGYISAETAETVMRFDGSLLDGCPFCTINPYGKGVAVYYAADRIDQKLCNKIMRFAAGKAGMKPVPYPESVLVTHRGPLTFIVNFDSRQVEFPVGWNGKNIIGNALDNGRVTLPPEGIALIEIGTASDSHSTGLWV